MSVRTILRIGDPVLRHPTARVSEGELATVEMQQVIDDLVDTMAAANGSGIAANQVGVSVAICVIGVTHNPRYPYKPPIPLTILVNPEITAIDGERWLNNEGCLSVPLRCDLWRDMNIEVAALDRMGRRFRQVYRGLSAGTVQHEVDHLNGTLIVDRMEDSRSMATWENFAAHGMDTYLERIAPVIAATEPKMSDDE